MASNAERQMKDAESFGSYNDAASVDHGVLKHKIAWVAEATPARQRYLAASSAYLQACADPKIDKASYDKLRQEDIDARMEWLKDELPDLILNIPERQSRGQ